MASGSTDPGPASPGNRVVSGATFFSCQECGRVFDSLRGQSQHRRQAHPDSYYDAALAGIGARKKARWDHEESSLMAREEKRLLALGVANIVGRC